MFASHTAIKRAKSLRQNQTDAEKILWSILRNKQIGCKFRRQHPIDPYIVDFFCQEKGLIIELDGGQHNEAVDQNRTLYLESKGFTLIRFWNNDVLQNKEGVYQVIMKTLQKIGPHPDPLP